MKSTITTERESRQRNAFMERIKFYATAIWFTLYGFAAITSLTYAALNALGYDLNLNRTAQQVILVCISITATPVMWKIGQFIWSGIKQLAKEAKE